jgi:hypothetical protein
MILIFINIVLNNRFHILVTRGVASGGRVGRNAPQLLEFSCATPPLLLKILFFLNTKPKKAPFQGYLVTRSI